MRKNWATIALKAFAEDVKKTGFTDVVLLGMGGSSLGPEVLSETFGRLPGAPHFHMLDATVPQQIHTLDAAITIETSLFITSSKSGGTLEPNIFTDYFLDRLAKAVGEDKRGEHFVAVTDPGSPFEKRAKELKFRHIFYGVPLHRRALFGALQVRPGAGGGLWASM